jgi:propanol-preferring alcohol dehydrogenase
MTAPASLASMRAMQLFAAGEPLRAVEVPVPQPTYRQILVSISACAVCRTDLHVVDGELPNPKSPLIPGHEIVGRVASLGPAANRFQLGERIGIPWLGWTCGECRYCRSHRENLCERARFTGYTLDGGYAEYVVADERFCLPIPPGYGDAEAAPLLCAGLIGYRCLRKTGDAERIGLYGFGAAAHLLIQVARGEGRKVFAFTRPGDLDGQDFARSLGAVWAGDSTAAPPQELDAAIIFAPVGSLVPAALSAVARGAPVVCGGIHMSDIPSFPYDLLWQERCLCSVANLTRQDGEDFFAHASRTPIKAEVRTFPLAAANEALTALRDGNLRGAAVLLPAPAG